MVAGTSSMLAQSTRVESNMDFGFMHAFYLDDGAYPMDKTGEEIIRIVYDSSLSYEDKHEEQIHTRHVLQIGRARTKFMTQARFLSDSVFRNRSDRWAVFEAGSFFYQKENPMFAQDCYEMDLKAGVMTFTGRLAADDFLYEEKIPEIEWEISDSTRVFFGYPCRFAKGRFRGRTYLVWFTEVIPFSAGPWKLQGLPGVILQAEDTEGLMTVVAKGVLPGSESIYRTRYPYLKVSRKQYRKLQEQMFREPVLFSENHKSRSNWAPLDMTKYVPTTYRKVIMLEKN